MKDDSVQQNLVFPNCGDICRTSRSGGLRGLTESATGAPVVSF